MTTILLRRNWKWIGHAIRKDQDSITIVALHWTPEGKRKKRETEKYRRRTVEAEMMKWKKTWGTVEKMAKDRKEWRSFVTALHANDIKGST